MPNSHCRTRLAAVLLGVVVSISARAGPIGVPGSPDTSKSSTAPRAGSASDKSMHDGAVALQRKNPAAAEAAFSEAMKRDPGSPGPLLGLAEVARVRNNAADYEKWLRRALEIAPENADVQRAWGRYQFASGRFAAAESSLKKAAAIDPHSWVTQLNLGDVYLQGLRRPTDAEAAYRQALALKPDDAHAHHGLGMALMDLGQPRNAIPEFERASTLAPKDPSHPSELARAYGAAGDQQAALATYARALKIKPDFVPALLGRGDLQMLRRDPVAAAIDFAKVVRTEPQRAQAQFRLGTAFDVLGRDADAKARYRAAIAADPKFAPAYNNLAALSASRKESPDQVLEWARRAHELAPNVPEYDDTLGSALLAHGDVDAAIASFRRATAAPHASASFFYNFGEALAAKRNNREAIDAFSRALSIDPGFAHAADARRRIAELTAK